MDEFIALGRREILRASTGMLVGLVVAGSPLALMARGRAWAIDLTTFTTAEGSALLAAARTMMPHDKLDDAAYALVVRAIDDDASKNALTRKLMKAGLAGLGADFSANTESERVAALKKVETSDFFRTMRQTTVQVLYATPMAYAYFGYEGESFSKAAIPSVDSMICIGCRKCRSRMAGRCLSASSARRLEACFASISKTIVRL
jgi:hypothetical protein